MRTQKIFFTLILVITSVLCTFVNNTLADVDMQEGEWEYTMEMKMEGMEEMPFQMPPTKMRECITKDDLVPEASTSEKDEEKCKRIGYKVVGNTVKWKVVCAEEDMKSESEGEITYSGNSYKGTMHTKTTEKNGEVRNILIKLTGRRIGECKKEQATLKKEDEKPKKTSKAEKSGCPLAGWDMTASPECEKKWGKLDFTGGSWLIRKEQIQTTVMTSPPEVKKDKDESTECLTLKNAAPLFLSEDPCVKDLRRVGNKLSWDINCTTMLGTNEGEGEITYNGKTLTGIIRTKVLQQGMHFFNITTKFTGSHAGECETPTSTSTGRDYTAKGRDYTSKPREESPIENVKDKVKSIKKLFGF